MKSTDQTTDLFLSLTPDKVLEAVDAGGLRCNPVCYPLNSYENRVYEVELEDRTRIVSKFYRPQRWTKEQIEEEHQFLDDLERAEIPVCAPIPFPGGGTLRHVDGITYCLYQRRGGRAPQELDDAGATRLGMLAGRLHNAGASREAQHRLHLDADTYIRKNLEWLEKHGSVPEHLWPRYQAAAHAIADITDDLMGGVETIRIHGDFHLGNVIERDDRFWLLDFDDMVVGPPVQDLWLALPGRDAYTRRQRELFLEGYGQFRSFDRSTLRLIEPLRAMRFVHYATWLARRWHDPVFPATWPHFGTEDYWRGETEDLEEQVTLIREENLPAAPTGTCGSDNSHHSASGDGNAEPLTNKDFFWDWAD